MNLRLLMSALLLSGLVSAETPAAAQQAETRTEAGLRIALRRGVPDPQCYARVFARHAVFGVRRDGTPGWKAGGDAYSREMIAACAVDRRALTRQERRASGLFGLFR